MKITVLGAGMIGATLARRLARRHDIALANRRGLESLQSLINELGPNAQPGTVDEVTATAEVIVLAVPFRAVFEIPAAHFAEKIVVDATNYYPQRDGHIDSLDLGTVTSSEVAAQALPGARLVKAFNRLNYERLRDDARPAGDPTRIAIMIAGDDVDADRVVAKLADDAGFDALDTGNLDHDPQAVRATRRALLERCHRDGLLLIAPLFEAPGGGTITLDGDRWRLEPA